MLWQVQPSVLSSADDRQGTRARPKRSLAKPPRPAQRFRPDRGAPDLSTTLVYA